MPKPSQTNATSTQVNPVQQAMQPYLNYGWGQAQDLYKNNPQTYYPGQTLADYIPPNILQTQGYQDLYNTGQNVTAGMWPTANTAFQQAASGQYGGQSNPAYGGYAALAGGTSPVSQNYQALQNAATQGGSQYAQQIGQYSSPMQQQGANAASVAGQYGQQIGQYAVPTMQYAGQAAANNNLGLSQLGRTAGGTYLDPATNPYMAQMVQTAMDPVTRNYQTSVAPSLDAQASTAGRYGSGSHLGIGGTVSTAEQNLGKSLSDLSGNLYGQQFARERQAQDAAAQQYGQLYNSGLGLGMTGLQNAANMQQAAGNMFLAGQDRAQTGLQNAAGTQSAAANQYFAGQRSAQDAANQYGAGNLAGLTGLSSGFNTGNQASLDALRMYPNLAQAAYSGPQATIQAGTGLTAQDQQYRQFQQQQIQDQMARYYGTQQAPWQGLEQFMRTIGSPVSGSANTTTPYFSNPMAGIGSVLSGGAGLLNSAGGLGGLGGLGGAAAGAGAAGATGAEAAAVGAMFDMLPFI